MVGADRPSKPRAQVPVTRNLGNEPIANQDEHLLLNASKPKPPSRVTLPHQTPSVIEPEGGAAQTTAHGRVSYELRPRANVTDASQPEPNFQSQNRGTGLNPAQRLHVWGKMVGDTSRTAVVWISNHLVKQYGKRWRLTNPIVLNHLNEWKWSRARCRIVRDEESFVVSVSMHDHDISSVEAAVHKNVLAIRIQLGSGRMLHRAEPLPAAMQEAFASVSWNGEVVRIELQAQATT